MSSYATSAQVCVDLEIDRFCDDNSDVIRGIYVIKRVDVTESIYNKSLCEVMTFAYTKSPFKTWIVAWKGSVVIASVTCSASNYVAKIEQRGSYCGIGAIQESENAYIRFFQPMKCNIFKNIYDIH